MFLTKKTICKVEKIPPTLPDKAISTLNEMTSFQKYRCHEFWVVLYIFFKGVLHPRPVFGLFLHFSQNLQHIGNR